MGFWKNLFSFGKKEEVEEVVGRFEVVSAINNEDGTVSVELDWDDAFIAYLRANGYQGSEENIIHRYVAEVHKNQMQELEDVIDEKGDYV